MLKTRQDNFIWLVGYQQKELRGRQLPSNRDILRVFFYHYKTEKKTVRESCKSAIEKCMVYWDKTTIPRKSFYHSMDAVETLFKQWNQLLKSKKRPSNLKREEFVEKMDNLFDISLKSALHDMKEGEDKTFLLLQQKKGRLGYFAKVVDTSSEKLQRKADRNPTESMDCEIENIADADGILSNASNYIWPCDEIDEDIHNLIKIIDSDDEFEEFLLPSPLPDSQPSGSGCSGSTIDRSTEANVKPKKMKFMTPDVSAALDRGKVSHRVAARVIAATYQSVGYDLDSLPVSHEYIRKTREDHRNMLAAEIKSNFKPTIKLTVQWDGKLMLDSEDDTRRVDRLPIVVSGFEVDQLLGIPKLENGTGLAQANAIHDLLKEWEILDQVVGVTFDTTASNTGENSGTCSLLAKKLGRPLLNFACRHHVYEILLRAAYEECMGATSGPDVPLFKRFQSQWKDGEIDLNNFKSGVEDAVLLKAIEDEKETLLNDAMERLKVNTKLFSVHLKTCN